ncbi:galactoside 2-alpha-L-fucosyltransferase 2 [Lingula anatina]|uniref:L-Fucosyltransferase n=1 Tax=Lingula anatina TaxID=7574 RepID=A0A1S3IU92_LINAN|nr:galactoside 2-alpha-L-fucosyltransferase 2 [Lingula anatina]|eukprot:XP_013401643.2 galactoside 2-alpha-L-fucosyltransferase 2 [Lingula anatina]
MTPVLQSNDILRKIFQIPESVPREMPAGAAMAKFHEKQYAFYDNRTEGLHALRKSVQLKTYFQSWKYFKDVGDELRRHFRFRKELEFRNKIDDFLTTGASSVGVDAAKGDVVYVGVHVRHGKSMTLNSDKGYNVAPPGYFAKAMAYFETRYNNIVFVVVSDDLAWCKDNVQHPRVIYSSFAKDGALDLALLASCNHTIMSVGTYSWWGAWLARGDAVYYKDWPLKNTKIFYETNHEDYFLPTWVGISV